MPQFNPPDWLIKEYLDQKSPVQQASEGAQNTLATYMQLKAQEASKQNDAMGTYVKAFEAGGPAFAGDVAKRVGLENPPVLPGGTTAQAPTPNGIPGNVIPPGPPSTQPQPPQAPPTAGVAGQSGTPIMAHWNATMGGSDNSDLPELPGTPDVNGLMGMGNYGRKQISTLESVQKLKDSQDARGIKRTYTPKELHDKGTFDPMHDKEITLPDTSARDNRREDSLAKAVTDYGKQIETNPIITALNKQNLGLHNVDEMSQLVAKGNTVASSAMGMKMARAMGEVGVVTENDVKRYVQSRKISQAAADKLSGWLNGVPSDATLDEVNQITKVLRDSYDEQVQPIYNRYITRFSKAYKITPEEAADRLAFPYNPNPTSSDSSRGGGLPEIGGTFEGGRVLKVTKVQKAQAQ